MAGTGYVPVNSERRKNFRSKNFTTALYLCLEDSYARIQNRLYELTDEPTEMLYFSVMSDPIGGGLEEQIEGFVSEHRDLKIVFIDTLQMVRG